MKPNAVVQLKSDFTTPGFKRKLKAGKRLRVLGIQPGTGKVLVTTHLMSKPQWGGIFVIDAGLIVLVEQY